MQPQLWCGRVKEKCIYTKALMQLSRDQKQGLPGSLGPVRGFQGAAFFQQFANFTVSSLIPGAAILRDFDEYIVFGDVHGDMLALLGVLRTAGVIDEDANWQPPTPHPSSPPSHRRCVVQLGDLLDRGGRGSASVDTSHNPREELNMIEYLHALDQQAHAYGEKVLSLSGNHELYALRTAFDYQLDRQWQFTTKATACPFPKQGMSRNDVFRALGARSYFAKCRPPLAITSNGWLFAHGDIPVAELRRFVVDQAALIATLRRNKLSYAEAVVTATNLLWAAHVMEIGGNTKVTRAIGRFSPDNSSLHYWPLAVCTCRTLANMKGPSCDCAKTVDAVAKVLRLNWAETGGIALGHTVQASIAAKCAGKVQLLDVGMSEAFRGFNKTGKVALLRIRGVEVTHEERG